MLKNLNKQVTLEGFYYDGSIPMLVESMDLVVPDTPIPPDKYVPIVGPIPPSFKTGAKVKINGKLHKPGGEQLQGEDLAIQLTAQAQTSVLQPGPSALLGQSKIAAIIGGVTAPPLPNHYALLIGTGKNYPNDYVRYWNDLVRMYQLLISKGYSPANIRVAYANGVPKSASMPVHYPATMPGITAAFTYFVPRVKAEDDMYVLVVGQGNSPSIYWTWPGVAITPSVFANQVNRITTCRRMTIHMNQSYSGGFIPILKRPNRVIVTASAWNRGSWAHPSLYYGNFDYWYISALRGHLLFGEAPVSADTNSDGKVSIAEAYNFTLPRPGGPGSPPIPPIANQMPQFEDNGTAPSRFGTVPFAGEGLLGAATYL